MFDIDLLNEINDEAKQQQREERVLKNHILSMINPDKKLAKWTRHFPQASKSDDSYLLTNTVW